MGKKAKEKIKITPAPQAGDNKEFVAAADALKNLGEPKGKRVRRTKAEIDIEKNFLSDGGFELFRDFIKMLSDNDASRYGLEKKPPEFFEPLAKQYSQITNYFLPKGKPIYFVCVSAAFMSFCMMKERLQIINLKINPNGKPQQSGKENNPNPGEKGNGQKFPGEIPLEHV